MLGAQTGGERLHIPGGAGKLCLDLFVVSFVSFFGSIPWDEAPFFTSTIC